MASYYKQGEQYLVAPTRSESRFHVHVVGVPVLAGTLPVTGGELVIDADGGIRTANFQLTAPGFPLKPSAHSHRTRQLFGGDADARIEFETQWARATGPGRHELDGVLRLHGQERALTLRAEHGVWLRDADDTPWYRGVVRGGLDRRAWELRSPTLTDAMLLLFGHDLHFEVVLYAGPRVATESHTYRVSRDTGRGAFARGAALVHPVAARAST
jgi:polyisoprenoid-binding protein YceI